MNGLDAKRIPKFLEGETLPQGYFDPLDPYISHPTRKIRIGALVAYAKEKGKTQWNLTKEEVKMFEYE